GNLNTAIVNMALVDPDRYTKTLHLHEQQGRLEAMSQHFARLQTVAKRQGTRLWICSIPHGPYVTRGQFEATRKLGFDVEEEVLSSDLADEAIRVAAAQAGAEFVSVFADFRRAAADRQMYFEWDGHFNREGHRVFGELLFGRLADSWRREN